MELIAVFVVFAYLSILLELVVFPVPSEASTYQLLASATDDTVDTDLDDTRLARARQRSKKEKLLRYLLPTALSVAVFVLPLLLVPFPGLIDRLGVIESLQRPWIAITGVAVVAAGRALSLAAIAELRRRTPHAEPRQRGPFGWSRNPVLVGLHLLYLGMCLIFPCVVLFVGFVPYAVNMHCRVLIEENHLTTRHGDEYRDYLDRVPRYLFL